MTKMKVYHLTDEEINNLIYEIKKGNLSARQELITKTYGIIFFCVKQYFPEINDFEEYVSIGSIGLIKAVDTFNPEKNIKFLTYAMRCIKNEILMVLRRLSTLKKLIILSYDTPTVEDESLTIKDLLDTYECIEEEYCDKKEIELLRNLVYSLPEREKFVIMNYYGFNDLKRISGTEIGNILGVSQSYVSRILNRTQNKLKNELIASGYDTQTYTRSRKI